MRSLAITIRVFCAAAVGAALVAQLIRSIRNEAKGSGHVGYVVGNFFSFFTVQSNILAALVMALAGVRNITGTPEPQWLGVARAEATTYMVATGTVYHLVLRDIKLPPGTTVGWSNTILHIVGPGLVSVDWFLFSNTKPLPPRTLGWIVFFPAVWATLTLVRGALRPDPRTDSTWYPYPFLDPQSSTLGYRSVGSAIAILAGAIGGIGVAVLKTSRFTKRI